MLHRVAWLCAVALSFSAFESAHAQNNDCAGQTQVELNACAAANLRNADSELNRVYRELLAKSSAAGKRALRDAQRAWIAYRDKHCAFETLGTAGGSIRPMLASQCLADLTLARTLRLAKHLACEEGDLVCGGQ